MNKTGAIIFCGEILTEIDVLRGSLYPGIPARKKLDEYRDIVDDKQLQLIDLAFNENAEQYTNITTELEKINKKIKATIQDKNKVADTFETLSRLVTVLDQLLMIAVSVS
jgi:hypothetical protein